MNSFIKQNKYCIYEFWTYRLLLILSGKINLERSDKYVALSNLSIHYIWKNIKKSYENYKFKIKYQLLHGMKSLNYL